MARLLPLKFIERESRGARLNRESEAKVKRSLELAGEMMKLSEAGIAGCDDDGCLVLYGILQDCAYRIRESAKAALKVHERSEGS